MKWVRAEALVRGLDYYRHTAFEFIPDEGSASADALGSQSTVLGGGRYDGLMESLGGPATPAVGWAAGIERLAMLIQEREQPDLDVAVVLEYPSAEKLRVSTGHFASTTRTSASELIRQPGRPGSRSTEL